MIGLFIKLEKKYNRSCRKAPTEYTKLVQRFSLKDQDLFEENVL